MSEQPNVSRYVRTINGNNPDNQGNINIDISELVNRIQNLETIKCGIPNYAEGVSLAGITRYTCPSIGCVVVYAGQDATVAINNNVVLYGSYAQCMFIVDEGDVVTHSSIFADDRYNMFYPFK